MKVAMVVVLGGDLVKSTEHLGVAYLSAYVKQYGYKCDIIECFGLKDEKNVNRVLNGNYDVIGFTTTCVNMKSILTLASMCKEKMPKVHITLGGHMATFWGDKILEQYSYVDSIMRGEGEITFYELLCALEKNKSFANIDGLTYRENGEIYINKDRMLIEDLDTLPFPVRDQFHLHNNKVQYLRICSSRGCLGKCGFCSSFVGRAQKDFKWRGRSPKNVVDEIEGLVQKYNFHTFDFIDSTFEDPGKEGKERIRKIAEELINRKLDIYYNCCFRAENWKDEDRDLLRILIESGLEKVNIGFESGNNRGLRLLHKRARLEDNYRVIELMRDFPEIYITFGFIMFHPFSEYEDLKDNADFLYNTGIGQVIRHYFWKLEVYPSTLIEKKLIESGRINKEYDICDGMYEYQFNDKRVEKISDVCQQFLKVNEVWDFEIFDIQVHTFIVRMQKKYRDSEVLPEINMFLEEVTRIRHEMAKFNHDFFYEILENIETIDVTKKQKELKDFIANKMREISNKEYILGMNLRRRGYALIESF